ncbi:MAG: hypothetical protein CMF37_06395 [Leeuwenhoekiella sp.]|nr:hypothetical protein [Leeuwenhoekiella sp.]MBJ97711.1 hypothetical protein [Flavobacteriaceae bacterium]|tara:strand:- start:3895 stop:5895 length:2001 start_codon:yes stop_codon:yes gene_type:complete
MNIFKKKLEDTSPKELNFEPIELFQDLFHKEGYAYLRGIQEEVLNSWHSIRGQRDVLCKMNTGSGKTLVSLLMLYSKMIEGVGPSLYLCPDKQLLEQAKLQADLYGISVCEIEYHGQRSVFPDDFLNSKAILLCTFQKLFNSRSIFERDNIDVGSIVLDDAHVCLDKAREATTLNIPFKHDLADRLLKLFEEELKYQAPGTYHRLIQGDPYAKILKVPYWAWLTRINELIKLIGSFSEDRELMFKWGLIADDLKSYDCYVGPKGIEIAPSYVPFHNIRAFNEAKHRYILSATFEDQIDLIKDLGININSIKNALIPKDRKDLGLSLLDDESTDNSLQTIRDTANLCLVQDMSWREYHSEILSKVDVEKTDERIIKNLEVADSESQAIENYRRRDFEGASKLILDKIVDTVELTDKQKGWYFEKAANYLHLDNAPKSNDLQIKAAQTTSHMLQSKNGHSYTKIMASEEQASQVLNFIKQFETSQDFKMYFETLLENLQFSQDIPHTKFENAFAEIGRLIGFYTQEPEAEFGNGPDVLWVMTGNHYLVLEAKSRAIHDEITRDNINQLLGSGEWFKKLYGGAANFNLVTIQPPNIKGWNVNTSENTRVIDEESLNLLKDNLRRFVDGINNSGFTATSTKEIANLLGIHNLTTNGFLKSFLKPVISKKG